MIKTSYLKIVYSTLHMSLYTPSKDKDYCLTAFYKFLFIKMPLNNNANVSKEYKGSYRVYYIKSLSK